LVGVVQMKVSKIILPSSIPYVTSFYLPACFILLADSNGVHWWFCNDGGMIPVS